MKPTPPRLPFGIRKVKAGVKWNADVVKVVKKVWKWLRGR